MKKLLGMLMVLSASVVMFSHAASAEELHLTWQEVDGRYYWYENGVKQGTYDDPQGVIGYETNRGREIYDPASDGWYWLDSEFDGAKASNKEVWMPYIYQDEDKWSAKDIQKVASESGTMSAQVERDIKAHVGKWVRYDANGKMIKGWYRVEGDDEVLYPKQSGNKYYYDPKTGLMAKGWTQIDGKRYHFDEATGVLFESAGTATMNAETVALNGTRTKKLLRVPTAVNAVYMYGKKGKIVYQENKDYVIDYENGTIARTKKSSIPDYGEHFAGYGEDGRLNGTSQLNTPFQVYVDYEYGCSSQELGPIDNQSQYVSEALRNKIQNSEPISIYLCGDSIGQGYDTDRNLTFVNDLASVIQSKYGCSVNTKNVSLTGMDRQYLVDHEADILATHPDLLLIEFGMNDHVEDDAMSSGHQKSFKSDISRVIDDVKNQGIDVIIVGFPQENLKQKGEKSEATIRYNEILREIASEKGIYFADVKAVYDKVGTRKSIEEDVMADFVHHPNTWGHRLYVTSIMPALNVDGSFKPSDSDDYIYVNF